MSILSPSFYFISVYSDRQTLYSFVLYVTQVSEYVEHILNCSATDLVIKNRDSIKCKIKNCDAILMIELLILLVVFAILMGLLTNSTRARFRRQCFNNFELSTAPFGINNNTDGCKIMGYYEHKYFI